MFMVRFNRPKGANTIHFPLKPTLCFSSSRAYTHTHTPTHTHIHKERLSRMVGNREQVRLTGDWARCRVQTGQRPAALCAAQRMQFAGAAFNYIRDGHRPAWSNPRADTLLPSSRSPLYSNDSSVVGANYARFDVPRENPPVSSV